MRETHTDSTAKITSAERRLRRARDNAKLAIAQKNDATATNDRAAQKTA